jgi:DNA polymerase-3 subunit delta
MQIAWAQWASHLQKSLLPVYVLHGDEVLLQNEALDQLQQAAVAQGFTGKSMHILQGAHADWGGLLAALSSPGLFADKQRVILRLPTGKPGKEGAKVLEKLASSVCAGGDTVLILQLPKVDKTTQASSWFTALAKVGGVMSIETIHRGALPNWITNRLSQKGLQLMPGSEGAQTLAFLVDRVEGHLLAAHQEIEKLALLYRVDETPVQAPTPVSMSMSMSMSVPATVLSLAQVQAAVTDVARYDVFSLSHTVWQGDLARTHRMIEGLCEEGVACVLVHWVLAQDIRQLFKLKQAMQKGQNLAQALRAARIWGEKEKLFTSLLPRLAEPHLRQLLWHAHGVDGVVKGLPQATWPQDPWAAVQRLAWQACRLVNHTA